MSSSAGYERLHPRVQRWCFEQGWSGLRDVQERAVEPILAAESDAILSAATAAGKTEAAFLPIASALLEREGSGVRALCLSPLKALINDQFRRLEELCGAAEIEVHRWHGDVGSNKKRKLLEDPQGVLLITPESLEALFVLRGSKLESLFGGLEYVVIDEMHSFLGSERGRQMQSLLHRLEGVRGARVPRIGLSATLGDMALAQEFLRPEDPSALLIEGDAGDHELKLGLFAVPIQPRRFDDDGVEQESGPSASKLIADELFKKLRGTSNLVFASSRRMVEGVSAHLRDACEEARLPPEFFAHHGSLSKALREDVEADLKRGDVPRTVVCTSTLEMGIDIGDVTSVAQVGPPPSVASLRQRLGRSGRRGTPSILRVYTAERELHEFSPLQDRLREELVQAIASCELMLEGWCEPPPEQALHLSTLIQQVLSIIAQRSGAHADTLFATLCGDGPFRSVDSELFMELLRAMGEMDLIIQDKRGLLLTGLEGERLIGSYEFYAAFETAVEYRVLGDGRDLGTMPVNGAVTLGSGLIFAGRRWRIEEVDEVRQEIRVVPGAAGDPPLFLGSGADVHDRVRQRMREVLAGTGPLSYLDDAANGMLEEARRGFEESGLADSPVLEGRKGDSLLVPWVGDRVMNTISVALSTFGREVTSEGLVLRVHDTSTDDLWSMLGDLEHDGLASGEELAALVAVKRGGKYDGYLSDELLARDYASRALDLEGAQAWLSRVC